MANIFIVRISDDYPEHYWFKCKILSGQDPIALKKGERVGGEWDVEFHLNKRVSLDKVLGFDFLFSDGPNFVSPKLYNIMINSEVSGVQFLSARIFINGKFYEGYKVINLTSRAKAFDNLLSRSEPLLSYLPEGPKKYTSVILKDDISTTSDMFRSEEDFTTLIAVERIKLLLEMNGIIGIQFEKSWGDAEV